MRGRKSLKFRRNSSRLFLRDPAFFLRPAEVILEIPGANLSQTGCSKDERQKSFRLSDSRSADSVIDSLRTRIRLIKALHRTTCTDKKNELINEL